MLNQQVKSEIEHNPLQRVRSIQVIPLESEKKVMVLKPNRKAIFHGDCELICIEGRAEIINPLPGIIDLINDSNNEHNKTKRYYVNGMIFGIKATKQRVKFSLLRPHKWK